MLTSSTVPHVSLVTLLGAFINVERTEWCNNGSAGEVSLRPQILKFVFIDERSMMSTHHCTHAIE